MNKREEIIEELLAAGYPRASAEEIAAFREGEMSDDVILVDESELDYGDDDERS